jgi:hypothetical protein
MKALNVIRSTVIEGHPDLEKHGIPRFMLEVELPWEVLPSDVSFSNSGKQDWENLLKKVGVQPDSIKRIQGNHTHAAQLVFLTRRKSQVAFGKLFKARNKYFEGS